VKPIPSLPTITYTLCEDTCLIGKYTHTPLRCQGTDTLSYTSLPVIQHVVRRMYPSHHIVMEGDRITRRDMFAHLASQGYDVKLFLIDCPVAESVTRLRRAGSPITETFVKSTRTKSRNLFDQYGRKWNGEMIVTKCAESSDSTESK
jgi:hypothetical protein